LSWLRAIGMIAMAEHVFYFSCDQSRQDVKLIHQTLDE
jgi:hypothetical protein